MYELKDYLRAINETSEPLLNSDDSMWEKKYPPYVINRCLSRVLQKQDKWSNLRSGPNKR